MHPLNTALEDLPHEQQTQKRRSSLDNSCLAAGQSSKLLIDAEEEDSNQPRRLSLNSDTRISISFLASGHLKRVHGDLDVDFHKSDHARQQGDTKKLSSTGTTEIDISDEESTISYDDCDSFCDASVQQEADKEYLRRDLGASCIWDDTTVETGLAEELEEMSLDSVPEDILEVNEDNEDEEDEGKKDEAAQGTDSTEPATTTVLKRAKRRSFTKRIPRILFRSKSPKVNIRRKEASTQD